MAYVIFWGERLDKGENRSKVKACGRKHSARLSFSLFCLASCTHPKCPPCWSTLLSAHLWLNWVCPTITLTGVPEQPPSDVSAADSLHLSLHAADGVSTQPASAPTRGFTYSWNQGKISFPSSRSTCQPSWTTFWSFRFWTFSTCPLLKTLCWHVPGNALLYPLAPKPQCNFLQEAFAHASMSVSPTRHPVFHHYSTSLIVSKSFIPTAWSLG